MWVESICDEEETIEKNIKKAKVNNPDYVGDPPELVYYNMIKINLFKVIADFLKRIEKYKMAYQPTCKEDYEVKFYFYYLFFFIRESDL